MKINWKVKSMIFFFIDRFRLARFHQWCSKNLPLRPHKYFYQIDQNWLIHELVLKEANAKTLFEFGAGKHLGQNLYLANRGLKQLLIDIQPLIDFRMLNRVWKNIANSRAEKPQPAIKSLVDLEKLGISYMAPIDASNTGFENELVDAIISTNTFEHIPLKQLKKILCECNRILKKNGVLSAIIDYSDHYQHTDNKIHPLNFLKFSEEEWSKYNHNSHYQNRVRHEQYWSIFSESGFKIKNHYILEEVSAIDKDIQSSDFYRANPSLILRGHFVLLKQSSSTATNFQ